MRVPQRGRAILRRLSAQDAVRAFRPGDFVLTTSDGGMARLLGWATGGELNHAAIITDPLGTVVEANPTFLADTRAFRTCSVAEYLRAGRPCWIGYVELREGTRQDVVAYAEHLLRARGTISLSGRIWMALHTLLSIAPRALASRYAGLRGMRDALESHAVVLREEHCFAAAELVARALERGGFIWDRDPAHVTPAELFRRYHLAEPTPVTPMPIARMRRRPATSASLRHARRIARRGSRSREPSRSPATRAALDPRSPASSPRRPRTSMPSSQAPAPTRAPATRRARRSTRSERWRSAPSARTRTWFWRTRASRSAITRRAFESTSGGFQTRVAGRGSVLRLGTGRRCTARRWSSGPSRGTATSSSLRDFWRPLTARGRA